MRKVLVLAPHTDDAEIGCGGTLARFVEEGREIYVAAFSTAEDSLPEGSPPGLLRDEFHVAMDVLGVPAERRFVYDYRVRQLSYHRQEVLEELVRLRDLIHPDMVLVPSSNDVHQDHQVVANEVARAFRDCTVLGYELPWNHYTFATQAFVTLEQRHLDMKWKALQVYESQLQLGRPYFTWELIEGLARVRGVQIRAEFAEAFEVIRYKI